MGASEWIELGLLLAIGAAGAVRLRAWERPRLFVVIGLAIVVGVGMGAEIGLILARIDAISRTAFWLVGLAVIMFEAYRWRRRRRRGR